MEAALHLLCIVASTAAAPLKAYSHERRNTAVMRRIRWSGPQSNTVDVLVKNPEQLRNIRKRVQAEIVYSGAVAISVAPGTRNVHVA
ncbi:hypothetical protein [Paraburkholderia azotifigens]|uniref:Uncharacterized protein n=1 Tax=Paraburkholderia azotifigens TaxID=2057004 RepID=A0A5C6V1X2_9BURK|nr:hypothetical protein [Paraburkholderia azotifigens]TXC79367.1 hypothetical protein FRZ40_33785 [Paraburkholderia azotifigens]